MVSPTRRMHDAWVHHDLIDCEPQCTVHSVSSRPKLYVFPIGLFHAPSHWMSDPGPLAYVPTEVMADARENRVLFIFDQSQEGNAAKELWAWFYDHAKKHGIKASSILYMTSDHLAERRHADFVSMNGITDQLRVLSSLYNLYILSRDLSNSRGITQEFTGMDRTYLYNNLNRMPHHHRKILWLSLYQSDLLRHGLVSMPSFETGHPESDALLPMIIDNPNFENKFTDLNLEIYNNSWFSIVTETYVNDDQMLIGEKIFKPMMCHSPFMLLSTKGSLARLKELGFKTFPMLWDEAYDEMPLHQRITELVRNVRYVKDISDKQSWIADAQETLRHNHKMAWSNWTGSRDWQRILDIWQEFSIQYGMIGS